MSLGSRLRNWFHSKKCHNCGLVDSIHVNDEKASRLVFAYGPKDQDGLLTFFIYCRSCHFINIYKPGWVGNVRFDSYIDSKELCSAHQSGTITREEMGFLAEKIQRAMKADGVLPADW